MSTTKEVGNNIESAFDSKAVKIYALALEYAGTAINKAREEHPWNDQTYQALDRMFSKAFVSGKEIGFLLAHGVDYGVYLEKANDGKNEILHKVIAEIGPEFLREAKEIY